MKKFSASVATTGLALLLSAAAIPAQTQTLSQSQLQAVSVSRVRIVRLSEIRGTVQLDRGVGRGFEPAINNMPVVEQNRLKTDMGVAEVEFEDSSTLRLGPYSEVDFSQLGRTAQGATISTARVVKGIAYVSLVKSRKDTNVFDLVFSDHSIHLQPDTHLRLEINGQHASLAVLGGKVLVNGPNGAVDVSRKHTATFALASDTPPDVSKGIEHDQQLDAWDKQLDQYHARVASLTNFGGVPYSYGLSDMLYYGAFENVGGCGMMWRPYFANAAWNPYTNGLWASYSGVGYSWVSPYPWGWTPFHYGSWSLCPGAGWGWTPGGSWMGLNNIALAPGTPTNGITTINGVKTPRRLPVLPHPPGFGGPSLMMVKGAAFVHSGVDANGSFVFRENSAGLGIPRNELGNLRGLSRYANRKGMATIPIYINASPRASEEQRGLRGGRREMRNAPAPIAIHRGYAPSSAGFPSARSSGGMNSARGASSPMPSAPTMSSPRVSAPSVGGGHH